MTKKIAQPRRSLLRRSGCNANESAKARASRFVLVGALALGFGLVSAIGAAPSPWPRAPSYKTVETVLASQRNGDGWTYPAFPALVSLGEARILVTYKEGAGHLNDPGAKIVTLELDLTGGPARELQRFAPPAPLLFQCAEPVRFADGNVALFIDTQRIGPEPRHYRAPMRWAISRDGGRRFADPAIFPVVDSVGYGYPFEGLTVNGMTYLLVMTFGYLEGGRWSVDVLRTPDSGATWSRARNLAEEFGLPGFNEGSLLPFRDGFLVASRSYDVNARLHEVDREFRLRRQVNLTENSPWIASYVGRPRLFSHEGHIYLIGRNWTQKATSSGIQRSEVPPSPWRSMQLCLFRIDPETLLPATCWVLDNAEQAAVGDGYYAVVASTGTGEGARLQVITYKAVGGERPDLIRLEFKWSELSK